MEFESVFGVDCTVESGVAGALIVLSYRGI